MIGPLCFKGLGSCRTRVALYDWIFRKERTLVSNLIIYGCGGSSREILAVVRDVNESRGQPVWNPIGFVDDAVETHGRSIDGISVLGAADVLDAYPEAKIVVGVASYKNPSLRRTILERLGFDKARYATIVHPSATVASDATIGPGTVIMQQVAVTSGVRIGAHVLISPGVVLSHDDVIGDYVVIAPGTIVCGAVELGESVYVGARTVIAPGVEAGRTSLIGIGSTVIQNVAEGVTVFGNPATPLNRPSSEMQRWTI